jgi:Tol biopolymer transport system component
LQLTLQRVNLQSAALVAAPITLGVSVGIDTRWPGLAALSVSDKGAIAYRAKALAERQLMWLDRSGQQKGVLGPVEEEWLPTHMRFSVDGKRLALYRSTGGAGALWMMDTESGKAFLFKQDATRAAFSPNGDEIVYSALGVPYSLFRQPRDSFQGSPSPIVGTQGSSHALDVSGDGHVLYMSLSYPVSLATSRDILAMPLKGGPSISVATTSATETDGRFSPDSHWVAYQSDEIGGRFEIYVQPFPEPNSRRRISTTGGTLPQWSRDGKELYFLSADDHVMIADVAQDGEIGTPRPMFPKPLRHGSTFEMAPDGKRLLVNTPVEDPSPIVLLPNGPKRPTP